MFSGRHMVLKNTIATYYIVLETHNLHTFIEANKLVMNIEQ